LALRQERRRWHYCRKGYVEWRKSDGCGCLSWISVPTKWLSDDKYSKNDFFTHYHATDLIQ
ncbi:hypothetical protein, partial [Candidatus Erwinia dacicola]|uniref:hypothetical protein n=1 Tax=Candidatus Erwinia dacicola TaxID=252393 RepID=UPI001C9CF710